MRGVASFDWATGRRGKTSRRRRMIVLASALFLAAASLAMPLRAYARDSHEISRGKYLVTIGSCTDCHTPGSFFGKPDMSKFLGGSDVGFAIPHLGVFVGPNLTPDKDTGLGNWTPAQIATALTKGETREGRILAPPMPWRNYASITKADALAIAAYLKSLPPVNRQVPGPFGPSETPTTFVMTVQPGDVYGRLINPPPQPPRRHATRLKIKIRPQAGITARAAFCCCRPRAQLWSRHRILRRRRCGRPDRIRACRTDSRCPSPHDRRRTRGPVRRAGRA